MPVCLQTKECPADHSMFCQFAVPLDAFRCMSCHVVRPRGDICVRFSRIRQLFNGPLRKFVARTFSCSRQPDYRSANIHVECIPSILDQQEDENVDNLYRGRRIQISGHSDLGSFSNVGVSSNLTWELADTASLACPERPCSLAKTSRTFAAVICDADEPCSVNTAHEPEASFTPLPRSTTRPMCSRNCCSKSDFLR